MRTTKQKPKPKLSNKTHRVTVVAWGKVRKGLVSMKPDLRLPIVL